MAVGNTDKAKMICLKWKFWKLSNIFPPSSSSAAAPFGFAPRSFHSSPFHACLLTLSFPFTFSLSLSISDLFTTFSMQVLFILVYSKLHLPQKAVFSHSISSSPCRARPARRHLFLLFVKVSKINLWQTWDRDFSFRKKKVEMNRKYKCWND